MSSVPPGWANTTTPLYAGTLCGNVEQDTTYTTTSTTPEPIGFQTTSSWSDTQSLTSEDGFTWTCNTSGIYNLRCNQTLAVTNNYTPPDSDIPVIPTTNFYFDLSGTLVAPQTAPTTLHIAGAQSSVSYSAETAQTNVLLATFTTPAGFLTSTTTPAGSWTLSMFAETTSLLEDVNTGFFAVYSVDANGTSNPVEIYYGSANTFLITGDSIVGYTQTASVPIIQVADLTKRLQFRLYANLGLIEGETNTITVYFRDDTPSGIRTTVTQDIVPPTQDVVDVRITVQSSTSELDQIFVSSVPITIEGNQALLYNTSVNALANLYAGDTVDITVTSVLGRVEVVSETSEGGATNKFQWNLLAQGTYGNQTPVEPLMMMSVPEVPEVVVVPPMEFT